MKDDSMTPEDGKTPKPLPTPQPSTVKLEEELEEIRKHYKPGALLGMGDIVEQSTNIHHVIRLLSIVDELRKENANLDALSTDAFKKMLAYHIESGKLRNEIAEHKRLEKELNYILHPKEDFPKEPSFCDLVAYVKSDLATAQAQLRDLESKIKELTTPIG